MDPNWKDAAKDLAKALVKGGGAGVARVVLAVLAGLLVNSTLGAVFVVLNPGVLGGGHGSLIVVGLLVLLPWLAATALLGLVAYKQAWQGVFARAVESQAPHVSRLGAHLLGDHLAALGARARTSRVGAGFATGWKHYLAARNDTPAPVRWVLARVADKVPLGAYVDELAEKGTPPDQIPREAMGMALAALARTTLRPSSRVLVVVLGLEAAAWVVYALVMRSHR